jgi:hypothetical protein
MKFNSTNKTLSREKRKRKRMSKNQTRKPVTNSNYAYLNDLLDLMSRGEKVGTVEINLLGGRFSGKTYNALDFVS